MIFLFIYVLFWNFIFDVLFGRLKLLSWKIKTTLSIIKSAVEQEIENLVTSVSDINKKLAEIERAQQFQSEQYDSFRNQIGHVLRINTELKNENEKLSLRIRDLQRKDQQRTKAIDDLEQYGCREMLEIGGIPRNNGEICEEIVIELAKKLNVNLASSEIEACH